MAFVRQLSRFPVVAGAARQFVGVEKAGLVQFLDVIRNVFVRPAWENELDPAQRVGASFNL